MPSECEADEGQVLDLPLIRLGLAVPSTSFGLQAFFPSDGIALPLTGRLGGRPSVPPLRGCPPRTARQVVMPFVKFCIKPFGWGNQAQAWNRTSGNFCTPRAQWPGLNGKKPLRFCAPEILRLLTGMRPP